MAERKKATEYRSKSLERGIAILDCLGDSDGPLPLKEVCARTGFDPGTAYRYLAVLAHHKYVHKDPVTRKYALSYGLFRLGHRPFALATISQQARQFLLEISGVTGLTASIGALEGRQVVLLDTTGGTGESRGHEPSLTDAHACALGKVLLAYRDWTHVERLYRDAPLRRHTDGTITNIGTLRTELRAVRARMFAAEHGEHVRHQWAVAAAVVNPRGEANVAVALSGGARRFAGNLEAAHGRRIVETARKIADYITGVQ